MIFDVDEFIADLSVAKKMNLQNLLAAFYDPGKTTESRAACFEVLTVVLTDRVELWKLVSDGLNHTEFPIQRLAIGACHFFESSRSSDSLWNIFLSCNENRFLAIRELSKFGDSRVLDACIVLASTDKRVDTLEAIISLSFLRDAEALPFLSAFLVSCRDETLLAVTALAISRCGGGNQQSEDIIVRFATTGTLEERLPFVCELARIQSRVGIDELKGMLEKSHELNKTAIRNALRTASLI